MSDDVYKAPESELLNSKDEFDDSASRIRRLGASILDGLLIALVTVPAMYLTGGFDHIRTGGQPAFAYSLTIGLLSIVIFFLINYQFLKKSGQTIGKKVMDIKVVTLAGEVPKMGDHFLKRYAVYMLPGQIPVIGAIFSLANILFIFGKQRRCIHDYVAGTKVVIC